MKRFVVTAGFLLMAGLIINIWVSPSPKEALELEIAQIVAKSEQRSHKETIETPRAPRPALPIAKKDIIEHDKRVTEKLKEYFEVNRVTEQLNDPTLEQKQKAYYTRLIALYTRLQTDIVQFEVERIRQELVP